MLANFSRFMCVNAYYSNLFAVVIMAEQVNFFKQNAKNQNTTKATNSWHNNYIRWAESTVIVIV